MPTLASSEECDDLSVAGSAGPSTAPKLNTRYPIATDGQENYQILRPNFSRSSVGGVDSLPGKSYFWAPYCPERLILPKKIRNPRFQQGLAIATVASFFFVGILSAPYYTQQMPSLRVAMIGNSMMYYNDFPRFLEAISDHTIEQDSCLHGDASLHSILITGSGTYKVWRTGVAVIQNASVELYQQSEEEDHDDDNYDFSRLYDYGACTVPQLLFGTIRAWMRKWKTGRLRNRIKVMATTTLTTMITTHLTTTTKSFLTVLNHSWMEPIPV